MSEPEDIVRLYLDEDNNKAILIGGPDDGMEVELRGSPPDFLKMPACRDVAVALSEPLIPVVSSHLIYRLALDTYGLPRRAEDGTVTYRFMGRQ